MEFRMANKLRIALILFIGVIICSSAQAQNRGFGLGIIIGEPTGISGKLWTGGNTAIDGAAAWSFEKEASVHLHGDLLFHNFSFHPREIRKGTLLLYYGIGGRIKFEDKSKVGVRVPLGINYLFPHGPLDFFLEIVPVLDLAPSTKFGMNGALGFRYFFRK
jgi:hypothetical protein